MPSVRHRVSKAGPLSERQVRAKDARSGCTIEVRVKLEYTGCSKMNSHTRTTVSGGREEMVGGDIVAHCAERASR